MTSFPGPSRPVWRSPVPLIHPGKPSLARIMRWDGGRRQMCASGRLVADHGLGLEELLEAPLAVFAAVARLLVAAERRGRVADRVVQVHVAGAHLRGDLAGVLDVP